MFIVYLEGGKAKLPRRLAEDSLISSAEHWKENGTPFRKRL